jgi:acetyltransferase-like isoleucine patch superfamily enzyme
VRVLVSDGPDPLGDTLRGEEGRRGWALDFMGVPMLTYDLKIIERTMGALGEIGLAPGLESAAHHLRTEFGESKVRVINGSPPDHGTTVLRPSSLAAVEGNGGCRLKDLAMPWDLLEGMAAALGEMRGDPVISDSARVASTAVVTGPCVISDGVTVDDFCKIKGPAYIGPGTRIWTGSLVRESMIGAECEIGFGCEVARTYMLGKDRTAHHDVILDSILGQNVWMGAFIGTTNKLLNNGMVRYKQDGDLVDTGLRHFGAVFGHDSAVGAGTMILPGRFVPPKAIIQAGTVYSGPADVNG